MKTVAVIPCYNEEKYIYPVVFGCRRYVDKVVVVDNNSFDQTAAQARGAGAHVIRCPIKGVGAATGLGIAFAQDYGADAVVTLDGDGQHDVDELPKMLSPLALDSADLVIGVRINNSQMPKYRRFGNDVILQAANFGASYKVADAQCGFRALNKKVMALHIASKQFGCVSELIIKARAAHLRIAQIPVHCRYHADFSDNSSMNAVKHGVSVLGATIRWRIWEHLHI